MNIITPYSIRIAYPASTLAGKGYVRPLMAKSERAELAVEKYRGRGYNIQGFERCTEALPHTGSGEFYCPHTSRSFLDDGCLCVELDPQASDPFYPAQIDSLAMNGVNWKWGGRRCGGCTRQSYENVREVGTNQTWCKSVLLIQRTKIC